MNTIKIKNKEFTILHKRKNWVGAFVEFVSKEIYKTAEKIKDYFYPKVVKLINRVRVIIDLIVDS